jgi:hypothetical protein
MIERYRPLPKRMMQWTGDLDYHGLKELAHDLGRPVSTLIALAPHNDPFYADVPGRRSGAEWFAELWHRFGLGGSQKYHPRRLHYFFVSQPAGSVLTLDGLPYENTARCAFLLGKAGRDARYLGLIAADQIEDRRNAGPVIFLTDPEDAECAVSNDEALTDELPDLPQLELQRPVITQRYHVEIWVEKSTMNDILEPLARQYDINLVYGVGEMSEVHCRQLVRRAQESERPVRILYISDFDPAGMSMPVAVARKIEFVVRKEYLDVDIQLRPVALMAAQVRQYHLPRTPIKETERRGSRFEERFGEGATELDALEALHPGVLRQILETEIERYHDYNLDDAVSDECRKFEKKLNAINKKVRAANKQEIAALCQEYGQFCQHFNSLRQAINDQLKAAAPDLDEVEWPEPNEGDEDDDPLFDSTRDYVEQIDRYKEHQDKPTSRK